MDSENLFIDAETDGLLDKLTVIHCLGFGGEGDIQVANDQDNGSPSIEGALVCAENWSRVIGHNIIGFDIPAIQNRCKVPKELRGSHGLKAWGYRLEIHKGAYGEEEGAWEKWTPEMESYCAQDVAITRELYHHLIEKGVLEIPDAWRLEMDLQKIISHQERHGFLFDIPLAQSLYARLNSRRDDLLGVLQTTFPPVEGQLIGPFKNQLGRMERILESWQCAADSWNEPTIRKRLEAEGIKFRWSKRKIFNPNSGDQIAERMKMLGWQPRVMTPTGKPCVEEEVLIELAESYPEAEPLAEHALLTKRLGQIGDGSNAWLKLVGDDGRIHGRCNTMGTITFRFTHSNPNLGQTPSVNAPYGEECRTLFTVPDGCDLVGCDVSGLELRMLAHYMAGFDNGAYAREILEGDIHTANQMAAGLENRNQAKTFIYAFLYGAGDARLGAVAGGGVRRGRELRRRFLRRTPALKQLTEAVRVKASRSKKLLGLDGRTLHIRSPHSALNSLLQSGGSILTKRATVMFVNLLESKGLARGRDFALVAHVHDEWQTECRQEYSHVVAETAIAAIEEAGRHYQLRIPVTGESKIGSNWAETH